MTSFVNIPDLNSSRSSSSLSSASSCNSFTVTFTGSTSLKRNPSRPDYDEQVHSAAQESSLKWNLVLNDEKKRSCRREQDEVHHLKALVSTAVQYQREQKEKKALSSNNSSATVSFTDRVLNSSKRAAAARGDATAVFNDTQSAKDYNKVTAAIHNDIEKIFLPTLGYDKTLKSIMNLGLWD